jgi:hypothetical protein
MREALKQRIGDQPARISREEVEALGTDMGLEPADAVRLFDRLKGVSWRLGGRSKLTP